MQHKILFSHPEPEPIPGAIWPVFLPFAGCPYRCVYCAQDKQTGKAEAELAGALHSLKQDLEEALSEGRGPYELAFYGGTFTAMPAPWPEAFLAVAEHYRNRGLISHVRCSTRPDCVDEDSLAQLRTQGLDMVELGIQSFDDAVLAQSGRGYSGDRAMQACSQVRSAGLRLGIQLLPGLPGDRPGVFLHDAQVSASLKPDVARVYPCLVIRDTPLATLWEHGEFHPWHLERAKEELAAALLLFWEKGVRVIRLGLPPEGSLAEHILAGPWHPALGQSARGRALYELIRIQINELGSHSSLCLDVPRRYQGELMGHANELASRYIDLGLSKKNIRYATIRDFCLSPS
ncbi:elongator complex protein 3 [Pseudodesulfovibrio piezophilus]|uniref:Radical SAM domain protein n=1 Tax=Pseudodesulfovibrio piezophilus (strain DSM 21447 / JCM 15486 / C1TLV30) TaxID=1322246 RepID=M1WMB0_PSEP2|nr:radical SAM protein [Pseudodesulfovibrio piezophilus]CCH49290.1 Radical SAM domain protein [Pseudodesulfovibrio piezophilus C1TLV30]